MAIYLFIYFARHCIWMRMLSGFHKLDKTILLFYSRTKYSSHTSYYSLFTILNKHETYLLLISVYINIFCTFIWRARHLSNMWPAQTFYIKDHTPADHHVITCPSSLARLKQELNPNPNPNPDRWISLTPNDVQVRVYDHRYIDWRFGLLWVFMSLLLQNNSFSFWTPQKWGKVKSSRIRKSKSEVRVNRVINREMCLTVFF